MDYTREDADSIAAQIVAEQIQKNDVAIADAELNLSTARFCADLRAYDGKAEDPEIAAAEAEQQKALDEQLARRERLAGRGAAPDNATKERLTFLRDHVKFLEANHMGHMLLADLATTDDEREHNMVQCLSIEGARAAAFAEIADLEASIDEKKAEKA